MSKFYYMTQLTLKQKAILPAALIACCFTLLSFTLGGDSYSVYLNSKLIFTTYVHSKAPAWKPVELSNDNSNDQLTVEYNHCGVVGTSRKILLKDEKDNLVKEWKFSDQSGKVMRIEVKDILQIKNAPAHLKLYYVSGRYLPEGRMLTTLNLDRKSNARVAVAKQ